MMIFTLKEEEMQVDKEAPTQTLLLLRRATEPMNEQKVSSVSRDRRDFL